MEGRNGVPGSEDRLSLIVQDYNFASEIGWLGSGIQMWLQIMWFLSRVDENSIIILDEPDIYMHPDLQRKLIRLLANNYKQIIIATHSVEIISEVEPNNILIIDKTKSKSIYADKIPVVQSILNSIGSIHNLQLTKLWTSKKLLIVEGEDITILKRLQSNLYPKSSEPFDIIPNFDISGWGGWNYAKGSSLLLKETVDKSMKIYCIFDSDYHTPNQIETRKKEARNFNVNIHIWSKKEIENYLINIDAINRIVLREGNKNMHTYSIDDVKKTLEQIVSEMMDDLIDKIAEEIKVEHRDWGISKLRLTAKSYIKSPLDRVGGKDLISKLSKYLQNTYGVSINPKKLADELKINEIDSEIKNVITCIETQINFKCP